MADLRSRRLSWTEIAPPVALVTLAVVWGRHPGPVGLTIVAFLLAAAVLAAVHHAEVVALRVGEPFGSLVLAVAVTVIEVALILTLMLTTPAPGFAAVSTGVTGAPALKPLKTTLSIKLPDASMSCTRTVKFVTARLKVKVTVEVRPVPE